MMSFEEFKSQVTSAGVTLEEWCVAAGIPEYLEILWVAYLKQKQIK